MPKINCLVPQSTNAEDIQIYQIDLNSSPTKDYALFSYQSTLPDNGKTKQIKLPNFGQTPGFMVEEEAERQIVTIFIPYTTQYSKKNFKQTQLLLRRLIEIFDSKDTIFKDIWLPPIGHNMQSPGEDPLVRIKLLQAFRDKNNYFSKKSRIVIGAYGDTCLTIPGVEQHK